MARRKKRRRKQLDDHDDDGPWEDDAYNLGRFIGSLFAGLAAARKQVTPTRQIEPKSKTNDQVIDAEYEIIEEKHDG